MTYKIRVWSNDKLSNSAIGRLGGRGSGKARWWLRGDDGFVDMPSQAGDDYCDVVLDLEPGTYTLGCGGRTRVKSDVIRERVIIGEDGAVSGSSDSEPA